jgi:uncharacterized repeat protein (TIGR01451 family)
MPARIAHRLSPLARLLLRALLSMVLLCGLATEASANLLHHVPITDARYAPDTLFDLFGEEPLLRWIVFTGDPTFSYFDDEERIYGVTDPKGLAEGTFDFPFFEDQADNRTTAFFEFEVTSLPGSGDPEVVQTLEIGITDIATKVKWDEAAGEISGTRSGLEGLDVAGIPPLADAGDFPLRIQVYYRFSDYVLTFVVINDLLGTRAQFSWASTGAGVNPFENHWPFPGTDPDNLVIYPFVLCEDVCEVRALAWGTLTCDTSAGEVDLGSCGSTDLAVTLDDGQTTAVPGQFLTYTIDAANLSSLDVVGATVTDAFPAALACEWSCTELDGASCSATDGSGDIEELVDLPAGATTRFVATCDIDAAATGALVNVAAVAPPSDVEDFFVHNNNAIDSDLLAPRADLAVTLTDSRATAAPAGEVTYALTATNAGPSDAVGTMVTDTFPTALTCNWLCFESGGASCAPSGSGDIAESVNLPVGAFASFFAICDIDLAATGTVVNTASLSPPGGTTDPYSDNNTATDLTEITPCGEPNELTLSAETVNDTQIYTACQSLSAGSGFVVGGTGAVTLRAGEVVALGSGFSIALGGQLGVEVDPAP